MCVSACMISGLRVTSGNVCVSYLFVCVCLSCVGTCLGERTCVCVRM